jgi:hypothetical protein
MPTGYTADLESMKYDVKKWIKESVVRAFGVCMELRDEGKMDQNSLMKFFKNFKKEESYYEKALRSANEELKEKMNWSPVAWEKAYWDEFYKERESLALRMAEHKEKKAAHIQSIGRVAALYNKATRTNQEELIVNSLKFALDQLNQTLEFDYGHEPYRPGILDQTPIEWQRDSIKCLHERIVRYSESIKEEADKRHKAGSPAASYEKLVKFVDENCE